MRLWQVVMKGDEDGYVPFASYLFGWP